MKIVIVGGTGHISSRIVRLLLEQGHEVVCYTRGRLGSPHKDARHIQGDRRERESFERTMRQEAFDAAIDMICYTPEDAASSIRAFQGVGHFIQCSTTCTYGVDYDWLPVSEEHPLRPITAYGRGKVAADRLFLEAYYREQFPVTILKPSTTYGPQMGLLRQIAAEFSWIDRIRKGKPIVVCGDGVAIHQFLHVDDAALAFAGVLSKEHCIGQTYNLVNRGYCTWKDHHRAAMRVLGQDVELIGVPLYDLVALDARRFAICEDIFAYNCYYSADRIFRDVPEFRPRISLEQGMALTIDALDREGRIPDSSAMDWEDQLIRAQRGARKNLDFGGKRDD